MAGGFSIFRSHLPTNAASPWLCWRAMVSSISESVVSSAGSQYAAHRGVTEQKNEADCRVVHHSGNKSASLTRFVKHICSASPLRHLVFAILQQKWWQVSRPATIH